jgi:metal-responsive CopG/Arc/MetJ family transcriptional regulator
MQDGKTISKTRKGDREIISVSLPLELYDKMQELCDHFNLNRSSMVASAIASYLKDFGIRVGER